MTPLHGLATVSAGPDCRLNCQCQGIAYLGHMTRLQMQTALQSIVSDMLWLSSHSMTLRHAPVKFSTQHRKYPVGYIAVPADSPRGPRIPTPLQVCTTHSIHSCTQRAMSLCMQNQTPAVVGWPIMIIMQLGQPQLASLNCLLSR